MSTTVQCMYMLQCYMCPCFQILFGGTAPTPAVCKCLLGSHLSNFYPFVSCLQLLNLHHFIISSTISHFWGPCCWRGQGSTKKNLSISVVFLGVPKHASGHRGGDLLIHSLEIGSLCAKICGGKTSRIWVVSLVDTQKHHFFSLEKWTTFTFFGSQN